jgi:hypothetical protein
MIKTLEEWVEKYETERDDPMVCPKGFDMYWLPERGFAQYKFVDGILVVYQICGDIQFWFDLAKLICLAKGGHAVSTVCILPILPYLRLLKFKIVKKEERDGHFRFWCKDEAGRKVIATYKGTDEEGTDSYYVTIYVKELYKEVEHG